MQQFVSVLLSLVLLAQGFVFNSGELEKVDTLIEHAQFHKEKYGDDFVVFMDKHYGNQKGKHHSEHREEGQEHQDLPFQHLASLMMIQTAILSDASIADISPTVVITLQDQNYFYEQLHAALVVEEILQPPKFS